MVGRKLDILISFAISKVYCGLSSTPKLCRLRYDMRQCCFECRRSSTCWQVLGRSAKGFQSRDQGLGRAAVFGENLGRTGKGSETVDASLSCSRTKNAWKTRRVASRYVWLIQIRDVEVVSKDWL